jgi:hypothetical protein
MAQMQPMSVEVGAGNPEVVLVAACEWEASQHLVHHPLEVAACISETKRYAQELEKAIKGDDCCFLYVLPASRAVTSIFCGGQF